MLKGVIKIKRIKIYCPYCGSLVTKRAASYVYGKNAKPDTFLYVCDRYPACDSYVAAHTKSGLPMGTPANKTLRNKRIAAHKALDRIWENGYMTKEQVYIWLQAKLDMPANVMHIGKLNEYYCNRIIYECNRAYRNMRAVT